MILEDFMAQETHASDLSNAQVRNFWQSVYENQQAGIVILRDGIIANINEAAVRIAGGHSPDQFIGLSPIEAFVTPDFMQIVQNSVQQLTETNNSIPPSEIRITCLDGEEKDILISATLWRDGDIALVEITFFDITVFKNRQRLLQAIFELDSMMIREDFFANPHDMADFMLNTMHLLYAEEHNCGFISLQLGDPFLKSTGELLSEQGPLIVSLHPLSEASKRWILQCLDTELPNGACPRGSLKMPLAEGAQGCLFLSPVFSDEPTQQTLYGLMFWLFPADHVSKLIETDNERRDRFAQSTVARFTNYRTQTINRQQASDLSILYEMSRELSGKSTLEEVTKSTLEIMARKKHWEPSFIRFRLRAGQTMETTVYRGLESDALEEQQKKTRLFDMLASKEDKGITGYVIRNGIPVRSLDLRSDPRYVEIEHGMKYGIYAPIPIEGVVEGVIGVESADYAFSDSDLRLLSSIAETLGLSIRATRLIEVMQERLKWLEVLHTLNQQIGVDTEPEKLYQVLVDAAQEATKAESTALLIYNPAADQLEKAAAHGWLSLVFQQPVKPSESISGHIFKTGRTDVSPKILEDPYLIPRNRELVPPGCSNIGVPVKSEKGTLGVFHIAVKESTVITKELVDFVEMFGSYCGIVISRSQQIQELREARNQINKAYDETLEGWARALGHRDNETFEHTERVTNLAVAIGKALGLEERTLEDLRRGAILHDIGKIGIPDAILRKPGAHTAEEQAIMRTHAAFAYELLKPIDFLKEAVVVPYCHHERWDGSGYPQGLKGEEIPLLARIFTVADVYDAVTSDRPYRTAWPKEQALDYMRSESGKIFDPHIVEVFLSVIEAQ